MTDWEIFISALEDIFAVWMIIIMFVTFPLWLVPYLIYINFIYPRKVKRWEE